MLDKNTTVALDAPVSAAKFKVGDYVVYPLLGLSVISARKAMQAGGLTLNALEVRSIKNLKSSISIPELKIPSSALRRPASPEEFKEVLELVAGKAKDGGGRWHVRAEKYEERMKLAGVLDLASIIRDIVGKSRHKKYAGKAYEKVPSDIALSYSENVLVNDALDLLASEMSFVTGTLMTEAKRMFMAAALVPDFDIKSLSFSLKGDSAMSPKRFQSTFNRTIQEASRMGDVQLNITIPAAPPPTVIRPATPKVQAPAYTPGRIAVGSRSRPQKIQEKRNISPELQNLYRELRGDCILHGFKGSAFGLALRSCRPDEFELLCKLYFRKKDRPVNIERLAEQKKVSVDALWRMTEDAFDRLKQRGRIERLKAFDHLTFQKPDKEPANDPGVLEENAEFYSSIKENVASGFKTRAFRIAARSMSKDEFMLATRSFFLNKSHTPTLNVLAEERKETIDETRDVLEKLLQKLVVLTEADKKAPGILKLPIVKDSKPAKVKTPNPPKASVLSLKEAFVASLSEEARASYLAEEANVSAFGIPRSILRKAVQILTPEEFDILSKSSIRTKGSTMTIETIAAEKETTPEAVLTIRNAAAQKLRSAMPDHLKHAALADYAPPKVKVTSSYTPKIPFAPKAGNEEIYASELKFAPKAGLAKGVFLKAVTILEKNEFEILSRMALRHKDHIESLETVSTALKMDKDAVLVIRNAASVKLRAEYSHLSSNSLISALKDYVVPAQAKASAEKVPFAPKEGSEAIYASESKYAAEYGGMYGIFRKASQILDKEEFEILSRMALRKREHLQPLETVMAEMKMEKEQILTIRNRAAEKLRPHYTHAPRLLSYAAVNPYQEPKASTPRAAGAKKAPFEPAEELREVYNSELKFAAEKGLMRGFFFTAAKTLGKEEFEILSRMALRQKEHVQTLETVMTEMKMEKDQVLTIRNRAAEKLRTHYDLSAKIMGFAALSPYKEPKAGMPKAATIKKAAFEPKEELRAIFATEVQFAAQKGLMRSIFFKAAVALEPDEFEVISKTALRSKEQLVDIESVMKEKELTRDQVIDIRNRASRKLKAQFEGASPIVLRLSALNDFKAKAVKERSEKAAPVPLAAQWVARIVDGQLLVGVALPLDALKGKDGFKVDFTIVEEDGKPVLVEGEGKLGKGRGGRFAGKAKVIEPKQP